MTDAEYKDVDSTEVTEVPHRTAIRDEKIVDVLNAVSPIHDHYTLESVEGERRFTLFRYVGGDD